MMMVRVVVPILRQIHVWIPRDFRLGARRGRGVNGLQQSGGIRDRLEQLRMRPGAHDIGHVVRG
jgi:hypothetical protein